MTSTTQELNLKYLPSSSRKAKDYDVIELERLWKPVFDRYDTDNDGKIPLQELKNLLTTEADISKDLPPEVIKEILEWADLNKDNYLSYSEFEHMMHAADLGAARPRFHRLVRYAALAVIPKSHRAIVVRHYIEHYDCMPPPIFLLLVSVIELAVYIYYCVKLDEFSATGPVPIDSHLIYNPYRRYEAWRFLTYMLIHAGAVHIFFNLLVQIILGIPLEMVHKWWRVGLVYMAGVIAGSLGASISDPKTFLAGASGGVYALIAAHLANVVIVSV
ncbi:rhomboid-related protein 3-like isoform X1 [Centruroides sculpturatus]|uniref:rhomboid-related protein 3-like isoform X1 n=1 Tax=Centruroides sculpturatus TaxID=218467 RepID=UPI000C6E1C92|nr:rhomboid-related protein 3-like isoform X1 [Centruroides sculpturatus]